MRLKLISCEVFYREMCHAIARSPHQVDLEFLPKGLHDMPCHEMQSRLQAIVDRVDAEKYDAIVMGYGLCNNGLSGLRAPQGLRLVLPRAHDCITLFFGSKEKYLDYFNAKPGVYFKTTGWIERGNGDDDDLSQLSIQHQNGIGKSYEDFVEEYGEDNAEYLFEMLGGQNDAKNYHQFTFIEMGIEPDGSFEETARQNAADRGWDFEKVQGDLSMIERLINGDWREEEVLVIEPGQTIKPSYDEAIIKPGE